MKDKPRNSSGQARVVGFLKCPASKLPDELKINTLHNVQKWLFACPDSFIQNSLIQN